MIRLLGILVPALLGAALVWFMIPVPKDAGGGTPNGGRAEQVLSKDDKKRLTVALSALVQSPRELFGHPLQMITPDNTVTLEDIEGADAKFLARAYQECRLMMDPDLHREYLSSIGVTDAESAQAGLDESQMITCVGVVRAMTEMLKKAS